MQLIDVVKLYIGGIAKYPIGKLSVIFPRRVLEWGHFTCSAMERYVAYKQ